MSDCQALPLLESVWHVAKNGFKKVKGRRRRGGEYSEKTQGREMLKRPSKVFGLPNNH